MAKGERVHDPSAVRGRLSEREGGRERGRKKGKAGGKKKKGGQRKKSPPR